MTTRHGNRVRRLAALTLVGVTATALAACGGNSSAGTTGSSGADATEPIKVGILGPMSNEYGTWQKLAAQVAADKINADGGMNGRQVELVFGDSQGDPTKAVTEMTRLVKQEKVNFVVGPLTSAESLATFPLLTQSKIANAVVAGSEKITPEVAPYGMAIKSTSRQDVLQMIAASKAKGYKTIGIIHDDGVYAVEGAKLVKEEADKAGITVVGEQSYKLFGTDMTAQLTALKNLNPDVLIAFTTLPTDTGHILKGRDQLAWDPPIIGNSGAMVPKGALAVAGPDGYHNVTGVVSASFAACTVDEIRPATTEFIDAIAKAANAKPGDQSVSYFFMANIFDAMIWFDAATDATKATDGPTVMKWIEDNNKTIGDKLPLAETGWDISATKHLAFADDAYVVADPIETLQEGIAKKSTCN